jgi:ankyrin repeat protein
MEPKNKDAMPFLRALQANNFEEYEKLLKENGPTAANDYYDLPGDPNYTLLGLLATTYNTNTKKYCSEMGIETANGIIDLLIKNGAEVNKRSSASHHTPLQSCIHLRNSRMLKKLIEHNADPNVTEKWHYQTMGGTMTAQLPPLIILLKEIPHYQEDEKVLQELLAAKNIDLTVHDPFGNNALSLIVNQPQYPASIAQLFLEKGLSPHEPKSHAALFTAVKRYNTGVIETLLPLKSISLNTYSTENQTPLMIAAENGYYNITKLLIDQRDTICQAYADPNKTFFLQLLSTNIIGIIRNFIVNPDLKDTHGKTALDLVRKNYEIAQGKYKYHYTNYLDTITILTKNTTGYPNISELTESSFGFNCTIS